jgi:hypothetical protein
MQFSRPIVFWNIPAVQLLHETLAATGCACPVAHAMQASDSDIWPAPEKPYLPAVQFEHWFCVASAWYCPFGQKAHSPFCSTRHTLVKLKPAPRIL